MVRALLACVTCLAVLGPAAPALAKAGKPPRSPNLLVIVTDDQRAAGTMAAMPRTRKAFKRDSTKYPNAHVSTPVCCPSRSTLFSGLYAHNHGVWFHNGHFADDRRTAQRWLKRSGYRTALVGKYLNLWPIGKRPRFWDRYSINGGTHRFSDWYVNGRVRRVRGNSTTFAGKQAARFIRGADRSDRKPWFLYVATSEPHGPLTPKPEHQAMKFGGMRQTPAMAESDLSDKPTYLRDQADAFAAASPNPREVRLAQLRLLQSADEMVGSVVRNLRRSGELRDTMIVFTSDNGLHWGEHGGFISKDMPYGASTQVPLLVRWPAKLAKRRPGVDRRLVSNVDIEPTLLDVAGVGKSHRPDGRSLRHRGWRRDHLLLEHGGFRGNGFVIPPWSALRSETELYVEYAEADPYGAEREYYRLSSDPWELQSRPSAAPAALASELHAASSCRGARNCP